MPTDNADIVSAVPVTLTKGATFAPAAITFLAGSAAVTIDGDFTTLTSVTNNSTVNQTFAGFVDFGEGNIDVTLAAKLSDKTVAGGGVVFAGGVKGNDIVNHTILSGHYELTKTGDFTATTGENDRIVINDNSSLSVKNAGDTKELYICEGATFNVGHVTNAATGWNEGINRLWRWSKGSCVVTNFTATHASGCFRLGGDTSSSANAAANANAVLKIGTLTLNGNGAVALHGSGLNNGGSTLTTFVGQGGVNIASGKTGYYLVVSKLHKTTLRPWNSDYTFGRGSNADYDFLLGYHGTFPDDSDNANYNNINFTLNTDDEAGVPRTITMDARIKMTKDTSSITVSGHGTNVVTSASPLMTGTYAVMNTATVVLKNGAGFANGTVSVGPTATLAVGESATVNPGNLTLADGAALAFNWTEPAIAPVLDLTGKTVTVNGAVKVKVSAAEGIKRPDGGAIVLTSGGGFAGKTVELADDKPKWAKSVSVNGDGNIVVDIKPKGMMLLFR